MPSFRCFLCHFHFSHERGGDAAHFAARGVRYGRLIASAASAGRFGVDLFFLLSAYLTTELWLREQELCGKLDLRFFYLRRILRIWPLHFLGVLIGVLVPLVDFPQHFPPKYAQAFVFMFGNWLPLHFQVASVMWPLWSVTLEEQFYLVWTAVLSKAGQRTRLLYAVAAMLITATIARQLLFGFARAQHS